MDDSGSSFNTDANHELCTLCGEDESSGPMILCDTCPRSYHLKCIGIPSEHHVAEHLKWMCSACCVDRDRDTDRDAGNADQSRGRGLSWGIGIGNEYDRGVFYANDEEGDKEEKEKEQEQEQEQEKRVLRSSREVLVVKRESGIGDPRGKKRKIAIASSTAQPDASASASASGRNHNHHDRKDHHQNTSSHHAHAPTEPLLSNPTPRDPEQNGNPNPLLSPPANNTNTVNQSNASRTATWHALARARASQYAVGQGFVDDQGDRDGHGPAMNGVNEDINDKGAKSESESSDSSFDDVAYEEQQEEDWPGPYSTAHKLKMALSEHQRNRADQLASGTVLNKNKNVNIGAQWEEKSRMVKKAKTSKQLTDLCIDKIVECLSKLRDSYMDRKRQDKERKRIELQDGVYDEEKEDKEDQDVNNVLWDIDPDALVSRIDPEFQWEQPLATLSQVYPELLVKIASQLARQRRLDEALLPLFSTPGARSFMFPDCSFLTEDTLVQALRLVFSLPVDDPNDPSEAEAKKSKKDYRVLQDVYLDFCGRALGNDALAQLTEASELRSLTLRGVYRTEPDALLVCVASQHHLRRLNLSFGNKLDSSFLIQLCSIPHLAKSLTSLQLDYMSDMFDLQSLAAIGKLVNLRSLSLRGLKFSVQKHLHTTEAITSRKDSEPHQHESPKQSVKSTTTSLRVALESMLSQLAHLERLDLADMEFAENMDAQGARHVSKAIAKSSPNLSHLVLDQMFGLKDRHLKRIARRCPRLRALSLRKCSRLTDESICFFLNQTKRFQNVEFLDLSGVSRITDAAILTMNRACSKSLEHLNISFCREVSVPALFTLVDSAHQNKLKTLTVRGCSQLTDAFVLSILSTNLELQDYGLESPLSMPPLIQMDI